MSRKNNEAIDDHETRLAGLMEKVVDLQQGLSELSLKFDDAKNENTQLREDNSELSLKVDDVKTRIRN